jgi:hypothetical protein
MIKKLHAGSTPSERPQIYSLTDFCLSTILRMLELTTFLLLFASVSGQIFERLQGPAGDVPATFLAVAGSALLWLLLRLPFLLARSQLRSAFGLDPRPFLTRLRPILLKGLVAFPAVVILSALLLFALNGVHVILWALIYIASVFLCFVAASAWPVLSLTLYPGRYRPARDDELPDGIGRVLDALPEGRRLREGDVWVDTAFCEGLKPPAIVMGRVIIPEKALSSFSPQALKTQIVLTVLSFLVNIPRNTFVYRLLSLALGAPIALILINSVGLVTGYPLVVTVGLVPLFWLGTWAAYWFSEFSSLLLSRALCLKLSAATVAITRDVAGLFDSIQVLARYNLEPPEGSFFRDLFRERFSPDQQIRKLKGSLMELTDEAMKRNGRAQGPGKGKSLNHPRTVKNGGESPGTDAGRMDCKGH